MFFTPDKKVQFTATKYREEQTLTGTQKNIHGNVSMKKQNINATNHLNCCSPERGRVKQEKYSCSILFQFLNYMLSATAEDMILDFELML